MRTYFQLNDSFVAFYVVLMNQIMFGYCIYFKSEWGGFYGHQAYLKDGKKHLTFAVGRFNWLFAYKTV
jgi:hypothetical protein